MVIRKIDLTIESSLENIELIAVSVKAICALLSFSENELSQIELSVVEAANNAVKHAYHDQKGNKIQLEIMLLPTQVIITMEYGGAIFQNEKQVILEFDPNNIQSLPESGMGLYILTHYMDHISYQVKEGKNLVTMAKQLAPPIVQDAKAKI